MAYAESCARQRFGGEACLPRHRSGDAAFHRTSMYGLPSTCTPWRLRIDVQVEGKMCGHRRVYSRCGYQVFGASIPRYTLIHPQNTTGVTHEARMARASSRVMRR